MLSLFMIILISGTTHTGKTLTAQRLMERLNFPYLSVDHLKMGLIRSRQTTLTPSDDALLMPYLWSIVKEIIKTAIENHQNLIVEGCYIPFDFASDFSADELKHIEYFCLIQSEKYIDKRFADIVGFENAIEHRAHAEHIDKGALIYENNQNLIACQARKLNIILIDETFSPADEIEKYLNEQR